MTWTSSMLRIQSLTIKIVKMPVTWQEMDPLLLLDREEGGLDIFLHGGCRHLQPSAVTLLPLREDARIRRIDRETMTCTLRSRLVRYLLPFVAFVLPLAALAAAPDSSDAPDAATRIRREIDRLGQSLKDRPILGEDQAELVGAATVALQRSAQALDAHRLYLALENLGQASDFIAGARVAAEQAETVASGRPAFESLWEETSRELAANQPGHGGNWSQTRAAVRALSEVAACRVQPLLEGARGFAVATQPSDGLLYLGQARGESEFAAFCASLEFPRERTPFPLRSMLPELMRLQEKAQAAFKPPRSIDLHSRFIALNSSLKLGLELDAMQAYAGSTYEYLEAIRHLGMLDAPPLDTEGQSKVTKDLAAARARLEASKRDESLAGIFLERAASQVAHADGSAPSPDEWRSARVILDQVLPAFSAARASASPTSRTTNKGSIRMTLVRWPYT